MYTMVNNYIIRIVQHVADLSSRLPGTSKEVFLICRLSCRERAYLFTTYLKNERSIAKNPTFTNHFLTTSLPRTIHLVATENFTDRNTSISMLDFRWRGGRAWVVVSLMMGLQNILYSTTVSFDIYPSLSIVMPSQREASLTALLVEVRCTRTLPLVLKQAVKFLRDYDKFLIIHSAKNRQYIKEIIRSDPNLQQLLVVQQLQMRQVNETHYGNTNAGNQYNPDYWYSRMMTDSNFWKSIQTPYVITLQSDTLICRPFLVNEFLHELNVSFIGGLSKSSRMNTGRKIVVYPDPNHSLLDDHLNGGFSLRNVAWTIQCIEESRHSRRVKQGGEDNFFRSCRQMNATGTVHTSQLQAYSFASDNGWTMCFNITQNRERICPFGVHKPWTTRNPKSQEYVELAQNCPGLDQLKQLSTEPSTCP